MAAKPPRLYYGWVIALALAVTETVSWGIVYYSFSVFLVPMETELGVTRAQLSFAFSLALLVSGVAAIPAGRWIDRHGARALMTVGSLAAAGAGMGLVAGAHAARAVRHLCRARPGDGGRAV